MLLELTSQLFSCSCSCAESGSQHVDTPAMGRRNAGGCCWGLGLWPFLLHDKLSCFPLKIGVGSGGEVVKTLFHSDSKIYWFLRILHFTVFCLFQLMQLESEPGKFMMFFWINTSLLRSTSFMQWPKKGEKTRLGISAAEQGTINTLWTWSLILLQGDPAVWDSKKRSQNMPQPTSNIFNCKQKFWAGTALQ